MIPHFWFESFNNPTANLLYKLIGEVETFFFVFSQTCQVKFTFFIEFHLTPLSLSRRVSFTRFLTIKSLIKHAYLLSPSLDFSPPKRENHIYSRPI